MFATIALKMEDIMNKYAKLFKKVRVSKNPYRYIDKKYRKVK